MISYVIAISFIIASCKAEIFISSLGQATWTINIGASTTTVTLEITEDYAGKWYGIGIGASSMSGSYAVTYDNTNRLVNRKLGDYAIGSEPSPLRWSIVGGSENFDGTTGQGSVQFIASNTASISGDKTYDPTAININCIRAKGGVNVGTGVILKHVSTMTTPLDRVTPDPSTSPSQAPVTITPTTSPVTNIPTLNPSASPTKNPTLNPSASPTESPITSTPTSSPVTLNPASTPPPTGSPSGSPSKNPTGSPSSNPSASPSENPTGSPSSNPSDNPTGSPSSNPSASPIIQNPIDIGSYIEFTSQTLYSGDIYNDGAIINLAIGLDSDNEKLLITISGPTDVWFGVGFDSDMMDGTYAITISDGVIVERQLGNHIAGDVLNTDSITFVDIMYINTNTIYERIIYLERDYSSSVAGVYDFTQFVECDLEEMNVIYAIGSGETLAFHSIYASTVLSGGSCSEQPSSTQLSSTSSTTDNVQDGNFSAAFQFHLFYAFMVGFVVNMF